MDRKKKQEEYSKTIRKYATVSNAEVVSESDEPSENYEEIPVLPIYINSVFNRLRGDKEFFYELLKEFSILLYKEFTKIRNAYDNNDYEAIALSAHIIKGSAANFNALIIRDIAYELEKYAKNISPKEELLKLINRFQDEIKRLKEFIKALKRMQICL